MRTLVVGGELAGKQWSAWAASGSDHGTRGLLRGDLGGSEGDHAMIVREVKARHPPRSKDEAIRSDFKIAAW